MVLARAGTQTHSVVNWYSLTNPTADIYIKPVKRYHWQRLRLRGSRWSHLAEVELQSSYVSLRHLHLLSGVSTESHTFPLVHLRCSQWANPGTLNVGWPPAMALVICPAPSPFHLLLFFQFFWEVFLTQCEVKGQGCRMCPDCPSEGSL